MELQIGEKLKDLRRKKGISIADLSKESGVSTGLISQIERERVSPSVVNLYKIAEALNTNISYFFDKSQQAYTIQRAGTHRVAITDNKNKEYRILSSGDPSNDLDLVLVNISKDDTIDRTLVSHKGEECGYVIKGTLTLLIDEEKIILEEGDSIHFESYLPHLYINEHDEECISIWGMTPKFF